MPNQGGVGYKAFLTQNHFCLKLFTNLFTSWQAVNVLQNKANFSIVTCVSKSIWDKFEFKQWTQLVHSANAIKTHVMWICYFFMHECKLKICICFWLSILVLWLKVASIFIVHVCLIPMSAFHVLFFRNAILLLFLNSAVQVQCLQYMTGQLTQSYKQLLTVWIEILSNPWEGILWEGARDEQG
jgi:hypothetical protein